MTVSEAAAAWLANATPAQIRAFAAFREVGCLSCGQNNSPGCACWAMREPKYLVDEKK